jgi:hypothetical protein
MSNTGFNAEKWIGRTYECPTTGARMTIGPDVHRGQFIAFGDCFIDVGDGFYSRSGGNPIEITTSEYIYAH